MNRARKIAAVTVLALTGPVLLAGAAASQELTKVKMARLAFPSFVTVMADIVKDQGFDRKNGIDLEVHSYGAVSAYYAALASGEVHLLGAGTHVLQKMRNEGVPIKVALTFARDAGMAVITADPAIRTIADLKGKTIAADIASSEYQLLSIYGRTQGILFGKDVAVVQAGPPMARTQLMAKRVDAAMTWEPSATLTLRDNPQYRIILTGQTAWKTVAVPAGAAWPFVVAMREDFLRHQPQAVPRLLRMFQDGQRFMHGNTDEADRIVQRTVKLPEGVLKEAVGSGRMAYDMLPAWDSERIRIWNMFKIAVEWGYLDKLPDEGAIYTP